MRGRFIIQVCNTLARKKISMELEKNRLGFTTMWKASPLSKLTANNAILPTRLKRFLTSPSVSLMLVRLYAKIIRHIATEYSMSLHTYAD